MHNPGRILLAGFDMKPELEFAATGPALAITIQPLVAKAAAEVEQASLQSNPYQVVVLPAEQANELGLTVMAHALLSLDGNAYVGLAAAPDEMSWCRALASHLGDRVF